MKRIAVVVFSAMMICLSVFSASAVDYGFDIDTVSKAVYLENLNTGTVVYEKDSGQKMYPASTTKIMTFIITTPKPPSWAVRIRILPTLTGFTIPTTIPLPAIWR